MKNVSLFLTSTIEGTVHGNEKLEVLVSTLNVKECT